VEKRAFSDAVKASGDVNDYLDAAGDAHAAVKVMKGNFRDGSVWKNLLVYDHERMCLEHACGTGGCPKDGPIVRCARARVCVCVYVCVCCCTRRRV